MPESAVYISESDFKRTCCSLCLDRVEDFRKGDILRIPIPDPRPRNVCSRV